MGSFPSTLALGQPLNPRHLCSFSWKRGEPLFPASGISLAAWTLGVRMGRAPMAPAAASSDEQGAMGAGCQQPSPTLTGASLFSARSGPGSVV